MSRDHVNGFDDWLTDISKIYLVYLWVGIKWSILFFFLGGGGDQKVNLQAL